MVTMKNIDIASGVIFQKMGIYKDPFDGNRWG